jgi:subtilase family serine protease
MLPATANRNAAPRPSVSVFPMLCALVFVLQIVASAHAQTTDLVRAPVNPLNRVKLAGHHPLWANSQNDGGAVPADLPIERLTVVLARSSQVEQAYTQFLKDQQDPASSDFHRWLTPVEIGKRFGVSAHDIHAVTVWLQSQNLHVDAVSNSRDRVVFSGPASAVGGAFGSEMHYFVVGRERRISVNGEPQVPAALAAVIKSISGLYTVKLYSQHESRTVQLPSHNVASNWETGAFPDATFCNGAVCSNIIFPADFATIYDLNGVAGGINGAGQTIAVVGRSRVCTADVTNFAARAAVTANIPNAIVPPLGIDPGPAACSGSASGDQSEATLDVTRSGSVAQGATVDLVVSRDTATQDGVQIAATYVVDTNPVPAHVMSISFGDCEQQATQIGVQFWDSLFKQAAGEGISVFVSSGDSGAAGCDPPFAPPPASQILSPNAICSSSYATCVGGTEFADSANPTQYWNSTNGNGFESALGYIPEGAWNEPLNGTAPQVAATAGGVSAFIPTPTYQTGTGVPLARSGRYTPDVAFSGSEHDGYFGCLAAGGGSCVVVNNSFSFEVFAGTSASAPDMAGIAALLNQKEGSAQGLLNPNLYTLAATPSNGVFHDVTVASSGVTNCVVTTPSMCNNSTPGPTGLTGGLSGYLVTSGYDEATGLGSINIANLLTNWSSTTTATATALSVSPASPVNAGSSVTLTATVKPAPTATNPPQTVAFNDAVLGILGSGALNSSGIATLTKTLVGAAYSITAKYSGDTSFSGSTSSAVPYDVQDFRVTPNPATVTITAPGQSGMTTLTIMPLGGFSQKLTYSCGTLPSEATCSFAAASATSETLTITTTAPSSRLVPNPFSRRGGIFYALLLPGFLGLVVSAGNRKRTGRGIRLLSLIAILALSTLWMPACGGGNSGPPSNPGTPAGTSTVTVTVTTGGTSPLTHPATITLTVQ